jgi:hypothetical protein
MYKRLRKFFFINFNENFLLILKKYCYFYNLI